MNAQQFIDEEEDLDNMAGDAYAGDVGANGMAGGGWFNKLRRNTQVTPHHDGKHSHKCSAFQQKWYNMWQRVGRELPVFTRGEGCGS